MSILKVLSVFVIALWLAACGHATKNGVEPTQEGLATKTLSAEEAEVEQQVARISEKLKDEPTVKGWLLVGDGNMYLKRYDEAVSAYREAYILSDYADEPKRKLKRAMFLATIALSK
ncbi:MAG: cytochrome c-type biogenesis protein CcmH/NrfG [Cycloclasticus pugetii]|mgnify:FL=1|jgi:cytochrome c-type biogenesis protein CcmH/NrfG|uniref:Tetratricopeptide repeat protein n=2 Tax=Cycloclasticus TaxID=34067 RepID=S5T5E9_9GAMM|nr:MULTISPECIES: hypothetical protein [Cycloclasticus]AGS39056.1 hypothetical protein CYCME_0715 [Cycloclasticus zancles 78-ME]ATI02683.1 hypothetical protein CPC19_04125 [Cycloclasticus sp. PY97N]EPD12861.1 hypothetical protein L196_08326 [Cycloclasticus pugetii]MBV1899032.1 hypothetical protein [Cycloclasticus sp.]MDF1829939.1 hypothetical protein [Cycloclasticus pugetii]|tara:strand:+ start:1798 stop:2148 length:351 start_codon:yes stop_codon:yes gene_type:complete